MRREGGSILLEQAGEFSVRHVICDSLEVLGAVVTHDANDETTVQYALVRAQRHFAARYSQLTTKTANLTSRMMRFAMTVSRSLSWFMQLIRLTPKLALRMARWETRRWRSMTGTPMMRGSRCRAG